MTATRGPLPADVVAEFVKRCQAEWIAAGHGRHVEDPAVLDRIAAAVVVSPSTTVPSR